MNGKSNATLVALSLAVILTAPVLAETVSMEVGAGAPALKLTASDGSRRLLSASDGPRILIFYRGLW